MNRVVDSHLSRRILALEESATIRMAALARQMRGEGRDVISLSLGDTDFDTPDHIKTAAKVALDENFTHYSPVPGFLDLRQAISRKFKRDNGLDYPPEQIVVSTGAKQSIVNVVLSLVDPGDEVLLPLPYWVSYGAAVELAEGVKVGIPTKLENDFKVFPDELEAAITERTKLLIFSSPCNPTGSVYSAEELQGLAEVIRKHPQLYVVSDEIYEFINFTSQHHSIASVDSVFDQVITVNGFSKGFAMTGWRVGYIGAPAWIAKACTKMQGQFTSGTCTIAQKASIAGLEQDMASTRAMRDKLLIRRDYALKRLADMRGVVANVPEGAFYVFPDVTDYYGRACGDQRIENSTDLAMFILEDAEVAVVPGSAFGDDNCIRISYSIADDRLATAMDRLQASLTKLH